MAAQLQIFMTNPASHRLQGNVEFMRQFGRGGRGGKKTIYSVSVDIAAADIRLFRQRITWQQHSPWSQYVRVFKTGNREELFRKSG